MRFRRSQLMAPAVVLILTVGSIVAVWVLVGRASASQRAELQVSSMIRSLADLQSAPFNADRSVGGSTMLIRSRIAADERTISRGLAAGAQPGVPPALLGAGRSGFARVTPLVDRVYGLAVAPGGLQAAGARVPALQGQLMVRSNALADVLVEISRRDAHRAELGRTQIKFGAAGAMLLLLVAFAVFYFRSVAARLVVERLVGQNKAWLGVSRAEARTDALTALGNRRALVSDFAHALAQPSEESELLVALFDLDGFKPYNDTFGHAAGDVLLHRLGARLAAAARSHSGSAYRMGGDEFCVLARCRPESAEALLEDTSTALQASGEGWRVGCSQGAAWVPSEATTESQALKLADERMYANKTSRSSAGRQVTDALLQVITEQNALPDERSGLIDEAAGALAHALGQPDHEVRRICLAAKLHDIGKTAIPASILDKPGPLDEVDWQFIRRHPVIGERIVLAAPALAEAAALIRSTHERIDGRGYPDGLTDEQIPLGSRIIAVCDAYHAMTSDRPYRQAMSPGAALQELTRHAGTQFDASIVTAFCDYIATAAHPGLRPTPA